MGKYTVQRVLTTQRGVVTQWLDKNTRSWALATNNPITADCPETLSRLVMAEMAENWDCPLNSAQIVGPRDGRYSISDGKRIR